MNPLLTLKPKPKDIRPESEPRHFSHVRFDPRCVVVGEVVGSTGMETVANVAQVRHVKDNTSSPFLQAGLRAGDKRAVVARRAFGKPLVKVEIIESKGFE